MTLSLLPITSVTSIAPTPAPTRASLRTVLWAQVLTYVDDFTLWVVCRRFSHILRAETEREFARQRLGQLRASLCKRNARGGWDKGIFVNLEGLKSLSPGSERATFEATFSVHESYPTQKVRPHFEQLLSNSDMLFRSRYLGSVFLRHFNSGPCCNSIPVSGLIFDHEAGTLSYEWKRLVNDLFGMYAHAQSMQGTWLSMVDIAREGILEYQAYIEDGDCRREKWIKRYGDGREQEQLEQSYLARLQRAYDV